MFSNPTAEFGRRQIPELEMLHQILLSLNKCAWVLMKSLPESIGNVTRIMEHALIQCAAKDWELRMGMSAVGNVVNSSAMNTLCTK